MSFYNSGANLVIQQFIDNYGNTGRTYNIFDYVQRTSNENTRVTLDPNTFLKAPGKKRRVALNYFPILCDVEGSCSQGLCDEGDVVEPKQQIFDIDRCFASKIFKIEKDLIRYTNNEGWDFNGVALEIIAHALPELRRALAIDWLVLLYDLSGVHPDGNAQERITVTDPTSGIVNLMGKVLIERQYNDAGFMQPNLLGSAEVDNWKQMVAFGGLNAQGQRIDMQSTSNAWYDNGLSDLVLNDLVNGGHILSIAPEVFKYVWYLENAGIFSTDMNGLDNVNRLYRSGTGGAFIEGTLIDPVTNIPWDLYIKYDECDQMWNFQVKHRYNFFVMPDVVCATQGVNGIMRWRTCPQVIAPCPTGVTPSPAVTASTYSWTPGDIFPVLIANSNIGGVENEPNTLVSSLAQLAALMNDSYTGGDTLFTVSGSDINYTGFEAISVSFNDGAITGTFA